MMGRGPLVNMEGEKVGGVYPALKVCSVYPGRNVTSWTRAQSSSLLSGHLEPPPQWVRAFQMTASCALWQVPPDMLDGHS